MRNLMTTSAIMLTLVGAAVQSAPTQSAVMQPGINVQMAATTGAAQLPDADSQDAWIVTIAADGELYFGTDPETPESLLEAMKTRPRSRGQDLYIKADARAAFSSVKQVLDVAHADSFNRVFLLTAQPTGAQPGSVVPPTGLPVSTEPASAPGAVVVYITPGQGSPRLKIGNEDVPLKLLHRKLVELLRNPNDRMVIVKPGQVAFADVAHVVDASSGAGAVVVIRGAEL